MARKRGRGVADVARYTSASSRPPSFGDNNTDDDSIASGTSFFLISLVVFLVIVFGAVNFGTRNIEANLEGRAHATLLAAGFTDVEVEAEGATVHLSGSISTEQSETTAFEAVSRLTGVDSVEGKLWPVFSGELDEIVVTGDAIVIEWDANSITVEGTVAAEERRVFIADALSGDFLSVDIEKLTILEGLEEESGWLGTTLGLLISLKATLVEGKMIVDPNGGLLVVAGEVEGKDVRNELNAKVIEVGDQLGFDVNPAIRVLVIGPTEEEIEELQVDLDALIEGKVVEFETKSFELTPKGVTLLDEILFAIRKAPEVRLKIAGHTDSRGSDEENQQLSEDRAQAVLLYLVNAGESRDRFDIIGYGEDDPADTNETKEGRARNRRIVFIALEGT
jgi:outer membrane protein OmpA-like peptidoglycan-associated protein